MKGTKNTSRFTTYPKVYFTERATTQKGISQLEITATLHGTSKSIPSPIVSTPENLARFDCEGNVIAPGYDRTTAMQIGRMKAAIRKAVEELYKHVFSTCSDETFTDLVLHYYNEGD